MTVANQVSLFGVTVCKKERLNVAEGTIWWNTKMVEYGENEYTSCVLQVTVSQVQGKQGRSQVAKDSSIRAWYKNISNKLSFL